MDNVFKREILKKAKLAPFDKALYKWFKAMGSEGKTVTWQSCLNLDKIVSIRMFSDLHVSFRDIY